jgi:sulfur carrier protein ThiS
LDIIVKLSRSNEEKQITIDKKSTVSKVLKKIGLKPDTVIVMSNEKPIPITEKLIDGQKLTILQVSSGG